MAKSENVYFDCKNCGSSKGRLTKQTFDFEKNTVTNVYKHSSCETTTKVTSNLPKTGLGN